MEREPMNSIVMTKRIVPRLIRLAQAGADAGRFGDVGVATQPRPGIVGGAADS